MSEQRSLGPGLIRPDQAPSDPHPSPHPAPQPALAPYAKRAAGLYAARRRRDAAMARYSVLGEPGWDMLLELFVTTVEGRALQVSAVALDAGIPSTTALRWLDRLESEGLVARTLDGHDARRRYVRLTPAGCQLMSEVIDMITRD